MDYRPIDRVFFQKSMSLATNTTVKTQKLDFMHFKIFILLLLFSTTSFGQEKISIPGFGSLPIEKDGDMYAITFGSFKKINFSGTVNPLSLSTAVGMDDLTFVPGAKVLALLGLQDIEMTIQKEDFEIAANIEDEFKEKVFDQLRSLEYIDVIKPILGEVEKTFAIRDSKAAIKLSKDVDLYGTIELNIYVLGTKLPLPKIENQKVDPKAIAKSVAVKVKDVATDELAKVGKLVASAAAKSIDITKDAYAKASKSIGTATKHAHADKVAENAVNFVTGDDFDWNASKEHCDKYCVTKLAKRMYEPVLQGSFDGIVNFYDNVLPALARLNGDNDEETKVLRREFIEDDWKKLNNQLNADWEKIIGDKTYVDYYVSQSSAENGGNVFRKKIRDQKEKYEKYRDHIWNKMMTYEEFDIHYDNIYFIKSVSAGKWWDILHYHQNAQRIGGKVGLYARDNKNGKEGADRFIKVIHHESYDQYVFLQPQHSDLVAGVESNSKSPGASLKLGNMNKNDKAQMFEMVSVKNKSNTYCLVNANSGLYLTAHSNGGITQEAESGQKNQNWKFEDAGNPDLMMPLSTDFKYAIENVKARKYIDIPGSYREIEGKGAKLQLWNIDNWPDRYFTFIPNKTADKTYFFMQPMHNNFQVDVGGGRTNNGNRIGLWDKQAKLKQQFEFIYAGSPNTFFIQDRNSGKFVDASLSNIQKDGCPVQIWEFSGADQQKWKLHEYEKYQLPPSDQEFYIKATFDKNHYWDPDGGSSSKGEEIKMWDLNEGRDRLFRIVKTGDKYWVNIQSVQSGQVVDVPNNSSKNGTQLRLWSKNGADAQKFAIEFTSPTSFILKTKNGKTIDIFGDPAKSDGWRKNDTKVQINDHGMSMDYHWQLIYPEGANVGKPYIFSKYGATEDPNDVKDNMASMAGKAFIIQSAQNYGKDNGGVWDIPGTEATMKDGMELKVWEKDGYKDQHFVLAEGSLKGFYKLSPQHNQNYCVDVAGGSADNGTKVALWKCNDKRRKNFRFVHKGKGRFKILDTVGNAVTLKGRSSENGSRVQMWENHNGDWMEWYLIDVKTGKSYIP
jgi:hypothetical protein